MLKLKQLFTDGVKLLVAEDKFKDQTIPLSQIQQKALQRTMFPIGSLLKRDVKNIAMSIGFEKLAKKKEVNSHLNIK